MISPPLLFLQSANPCVQDLVKYLNIFSAVASRSVSLANRLGFHSLSYFRILGDILLVPVLDTKYNPTKENLGLNHVAQDKPRAM